MGVPFLTSGLMAHFGSHFKGSSSHIKIPLVDVIFCCCSLFKALVGEQCTIREHFFSELASPTLL